MQLAFIDWAVISVYIVFALGVGVYFARRASKGLGDFFVSGRNLPWWIAGTSMVATTFAADTPLAITKMVVKEGIAGNWLWWNMAATHVMATIFFARLWRRANIITDVELIELRYSGKPATFLRGFRSLWEGIVLNCIVMGWVMLAMTKIMDALFDFSTWSDIALLGLTIDPKWQAIIVCLVIAMSYSILSGFWGVVMTDLVQFIIAMAGSILLAIISVDAAGGIAVVKQGLVDKLGTADEILRFTPSVGSAYLPLITFVAFITVNWWATKAADGGGYLAQRMFAAKDEKHAFLATLWYTIAHYALRPWPWIVVALVSIVVLPEMKDPELAYPTMVLRFMPAGLRGMMIASFLAAFMSTIDTQVNWGTSLVVNDFYKNFVRKHATERQYVTASRWGMFIIMILGAITAYMMTSIKGAWELLFGMTAGIGGVYIMRWFWWRVNAWSEIAAWLASAVSYLAVYLIRPDLIYGWKLIIVTAFSTAAWVAATLLTPPVDEKKLLAFYQRVRPGSPWWKPVAAKVHDVSVPMLGWGDIIDWLMGTVFVYAMLFAIGRWVLQDYGQAVMWTVIGAGTGYALYRSLASKGWAALSE